MTDNQKPEIYSIGQSIEPPYDYWYAGKDGVRVPCDDPTLDHLWWQYIENPTAERADDEQYTIFTVTQPPMELP